MSNLLPNMQGVIVIVTFSVIKHNLGVRERSLWSTLARGVRCRKKKKEGHYIV